MGGCNVTIQITQGELAVPHRANAAEAEARCVAACLQGEHVVCVSVGGWVQGEHAICSVGGWVPAA